MNVTYLIKKIILFLKLRIGTDFGATWLKYKKKDKQICTPLQLFYVVPYKSATVFISAVKSP